MKLEAISPGATKKVCTLFNKQLLEYTSTHVVRHHFIIHVNYMCVVLCGRGKTVCRWLQFWSKLIRMNIRQKVCQLRLAHSIRTALKDLSVPDRVPGNLFVHVWTIHSLVLKHDRGWKCVYACNFTQNKEFMWIIYIHVKHIKSHNNRTIIVQF